MACQANRVADEQASQCAQVAELVDALGSGPSGGNTVEVRVFSWAPLFKKKPSLWLGFFVSGPELTETTAQLFSQPLQHPTTGYHLTDHVGNALRLAMNDFDPSAHGIHPFGLMPGSQ